jgi:nucleoside-diphosphate-sugar epimerase
MARVLVTGGTGFIGSHLVRRLVADDHEVSVLTRAAGDPDRVARVPARSTLVEGDLRDPDAIRRVIDAVAPDWVFHAAGAVMQGGQGEVKHWAFNDPPRRTGTYQNQPPTPAPNYHRRNGKRLW